MQLRTGQVRQRQMDCNKITRGSWFIIVTTAKDERGEEFKPLAIVPIHSEASLVW